MIIVNRKIKELIPVEYNSNEMTKKEYQELRESVIKFGMVEPLKINMHKTRLNRIIGGFHRMQVWKELDHKMIPTTEEKLTLPKEKELNLRLNKNRGHFNWDMLANNYEVEDLKLYGFSDEQIYGIEQIKETKQIPDKGKIKFAEELLLEHNYVVLTFDNAMDWQVAQEKLGLTKVKSGIKTEKSQKVGIARVIDGRKILDRL
ncbi:MAG: ParB N-terminal domain-containing protein [Mariprofundaceae bacterium]|nr:ParB N-terminal domain-containing protein [Mariprofundaceae bacterium]